MPSWFSSPKQCLRAILVIVSLAIVVALFIAAWKALVPFFVGAVLAYLLMPLVDFLDRHFPDLLKRIRWSRPLAIILVYIVVLGLVAGILAYFIPEVSKQVKTLGEIIAPYLDIGTIKSLWSSLWSSIPESVRQWIETNLPNVNVQRTIETLLGAFQKGLRVTVATVSQTIGFILGILVVPFWLFLVLRDAEKVRNAFYNLFPEKAREDVRCIVRIMDDLLGAYVRGQLLLCLIVGTMATIALLILGVNLALLLGTLAGILEVIPVLGPYLGAIPAVLMALLKRPITALWVAIAFAIIQQIENIFLVPRISGSAVRFHPALVMIIVVVASQIAGLWGLALGVPIAAILRDIFRYLYLRTAEPGMSPQQALENLHPQSLAQPFPSEDN